MLKSVILPIQRTLLLNKHTKKQTDEPVTCAAVLPTVLFISADDIISGATVRERITLTSVTGTQTTFHFSKLQVKREIARARESTRAIESGEREADRQKRLFLITFFLFSLSLFLS